VGAVLLAILGPTVGFGLFALVCMRFGAESRPWFDERPVVDDRPNWFPIAGAGRDDRDGDDEPSAGEPEPARTAVPAPRRQPRALPAPVASASSAATRPSGV
jgi:hypothetical protein